MKRVLSVFLTVAMLLCLPVTTFASEVEESQPSACTVHTLDELKAAVNYGRITARHNEHDKVCAAARE